MTSVRDAHSQNFDTQTFDMDTRPYKRQYRGPRYGRRLYRPRYGFRYGTSRYYTRVGSHGGSVRGLRIPRGPAGASFMSSSTEILNAQPKGGMRVHAYLDNSYTVSTGLALGGMFSFDPAGVYGIHQGASVPNWVNMVALFDEYKVNKITITARYTPSDQAEDAGSCQIYFCENRDPNLTGTKAQVLNKPNLVHHVFTEENPMIKCEITPYTLDSVYNTGILTGSSRAPQVMTWTDTDVPAMIFGWLWNADVPAGTIQNAAIRFSYEYDISFRYRQ